jgi:GGDEF domain-containing protein
MGHNNIKILLVDSMPLFLKEFLLTRGYEVFEAGNEQELFSVAYEKRPDVLIGDLEITGLNPITACKRIKNDVILNNMAIVIVTTKDALKKKIEAINGGADDYIVKPFYPEELIARMNGIVRRTKQAINSNPLSLLPGNIMIEMETARRIQENAPLAVCYVDIDNFKAFNDYYGYERGDAAIRMTANIVSTIIRQYNHVRHGESAQGMTRMDHFLGHIGGDDFVIITTPDWIDLLCSYIIEKFDEMVPSLYDEDDVERGYIITKTRQGNVQEFPIMTLSIAVVTNEERNFTHNGQISKAASELKAYIKKLPNSKYLKDRRKDVFLNMKASEPDENLAKNKALALH